MVLQSLGEHLHPRFGDVIGRIAGRRGDALFGAGIHDQSRQTAGNHARREDLRHCDDATQIDRQNPVPGARVVKDRAARLNARIVQQQRNRAKVALHLVSQTLHLGAVTDIDGVGRNPMSCHFKAGPRRRQWFNADIRNADPQPHLAQTVCRRQTDARGPSSDQRDRVFAQGRVHSDFLMKGCTARQFGNPTADIRTRPPISRNPS